MEKMRMKFKYLEIFWNKLKICVLKTFCIFVVYPKHLDQIEMSTFYEQQLYIDGVLASDQGSLESIQELCSIIRSQFPPETTGSGRRCTICNYKNSNHTTFCKFCKRRIPKKGIQAPAAPRLLENDCRKCGSDCSEGHSKGPAVRMTNCGCIWHTECLRRRLTVQKKSWCSCDQKLKIPEDILDVSI